MEKSGAVSPRLHKRDWAETEAKEMDYALLHQRTLRVSERV